MELLEALGSATIDRDQRDGRVYGLQYGVVTDVDTKLGRVKARWGSMDKSATNSQQSGWLDPGWPGSIEGVPVSGEPCFVAFVDGDVHRGVYWWHPTTTTKNRAQDFMLLGTTFVGMFNFAMDQLNQLRTDFNSFASTFSGHGHPFSGTVSGGACSGNTTGITATQSATTALAANKGKASDGSVVSNQTSSVTVLSGRAKIK